jgi:hypothetical protein
VRAASTYRGARRNRMRDTFLLQNWWHQGHDIAANQAAKINERAAMANDARKAIAAAYAGAGVLAGPYTANFALLRFYVGQKRTRVVNRIIKGLVKSLPPALVA